MGVDDRVKTMEETMRISAVAFSFLIATAVIPAKAQQTADPHAVQQEADKGVKTKNSGESGVVGEQPKPGSAASMPGQMGNSSNPTPNAPTSGTGVAGAPGNKNGPAANSSTTGVNQTVPQQDSSNVKGLPGGKSGPPAKA